MENKPWKQLLALSRKPKQKKTKKKFLQSDPTKYLLKIQSLNFYLS